MDLNRTEIATCEMQRVILDFAQGHQAFAMSLAGKIELVTQRVNQMGGGTSEAIRANKKMEDTGQRNGVGNRWSKPIADYKTWETLATLSSNNDSMLDYPEWYSKFKSIYLVLQRQCKRDIFEYIEANKEEDYDHKAESSRGSGATRGIRRMEFGPFVGTNK